MISKEKNEIGSKKVSTCRKCGVILTDENWYPSYEKRYIYICKKCDIKCSKGWQQNNRDKYNQSQREWHQNNRDKHNQLNKEERRRLRDEVFDAYGGKCACCGESRKEYLTIDHVNGGGKKHRKEINARTSQEFYRWLKQNNYPEGFQVLCFNCNCGKGTYSVSPHNKEVFEKEFEEKLKESGDARYTWDLRMDIIEGYGGKCELCGEDNLHSLTIDHVNGGGSEERKMLGGQQAVYRKLRDENYPKDNYRLLCYNCNCALGFKRITEEEILQQNKH